MMLLFSEPVKNKVWENFLVWCNSNWFNRNVPYESWNPWPSDSYTDWCLNFEHSPYLFPPETSSWAQCATNLCLSVQVIAFGTTKWTLVLLYIWARRSNQSWHYGKWEWIIRSLWCCCYSEVKFSVLCMWFSIFCIAACLIHSLIIFLCYS